MKRFYWVCFFLMIAACDASKNEISSLKSKEKKEQLYEIYGAEKTGIRFSNNLNESLKFNGLLYEYYYNGGGVAIADFDNDGFSDIFLVGSVVQSELYLNEGELKFKNVTKETGIVQKGGLHTGVTIVDINNDGWKDIYLSISGRYKDQSLLANQLFVNKGLNDDGVPFFEEKAKEFGLDIALCSTQASFFDYDKDGDLDMFLINHLYPEFYDHSKLKEYKSTPAGLNADKLYENVAGKYVDVTDKAGIVNNLLGYGLGLAVGDVNNDQWPDIYVSNDFFGNDYLYLNQKNGSFKEVANESTGHTSFFSMGNDIADINNDGWLDILTLDMVSEDNYGIKTSMSGMNPEKFYKNISLGLHFQYMYNAIQLNNGVSNDEIPYFSNIAQMTGISSTDWSWAPLMFDMDNDGNKDIFISNGIQGDYRNNDFINYRNRREKEIIENRVDPRIFVNELLSRIPKRKKANYFYKNNGNLNFQKIETQSIDDVKTCSNGAAYADLDNDGDLEIIVNNSNETAFIYKNNTIEKRLGNFLRFKFKGPKRNVLGIGARVVLKYNGNQQIQEHYFTRGFQSSVAPGMHFGLGECELVEEVKVIWPDGKHEVLQNVSVNQTIELAHGNSSPSNSSSSKETKYLFADITQTVNINYKHQENEFDDFSRESLLPHKMSQMGPALAVGDINNDGTEDFFVGGSTGHEATFFVQQKDGNFQKLQIDVFKKDRMYEDVGAKLFDADNDGDLDLYVASGGNEYPQGSSSYKDRFYENTGKGKFINNSKSLPEIAVSGRCVKLADYDKDGDIDLFIGGRQVPGKYPFPESSFILENISDSKGIKFIDITNKVAPELKNIGMITDALWEDFDNDGFTDLILAGEWMPLMFLKNNDGQFENVTETSGLSRNVGWWNCLASADFDMDGDIDLIAGNLGLNYKYKASDKEPFTIHANDFDENGSLDIVLSYFNGGQQFPLRGRECSSNQMPFIKEKFPSYHDFGEATLTEVYGNDKLSHSLNYSATNFASSYFENKGDGKFQVHSFDNLAQISSVNSILINDYDNDSHLDLLFVGNMYGSEVETPRNDGSYGLYIKGDGSGNFIPIPGHMTGLLIKGEIRELEIIKLADNSNAIIAAINNDHLRVIQLTSQN
ncbi:VCBS repeat-containing protein [Fulvivirgaceae bacterium BMA10]|uniref:VCBS repeat-containing protein n=1 Tax=Splendidivirga corallicola TaxID=3051826 RepID=A0ABT8KU97_9BACT|nr:VCBS repeat-containing protein [Fulvivirgaceae bacterium BMA10]